MVNGEIRETKEQELVDGIGLTGGINNAHFR